MRRFHRDLGRDRLADGGGWRVVGRVTGGRNSCSHNRSRRNNHPVIGYHYLHSALDDHSRVVYTELLADERKDTAADFWRRAAAWFAGHGITVRMVRRRVLGSECLA